MVSFAAPRKVAIGAIILFVLTGGRRRGCRREGKPMFSATRSARGPFGRWGTWLKDDTRFSRHNRNDRSLAMIGNMLHLQLLEGG